jgi:hypothetical protein
MAEREFSKLQDKKTKRVLKKVWELSPGKAIQEHASNVATWRTLEKLSSKFRRSSILKSATENARRKALGE